MIGLVPQIRPLGLRGLAAIALALSGLLTMAPAVGAAPPLDGSMPMLCSLAAMMECDAASCERITAAEADLPHFVRVDVPGKLVSGVPGDRKTPIKAVSRIDGRLILQGGENGRGWTATIAEQSGKMSIAVADQDHAFAIFGACIAQ